MVSSELEPGQAPGEHTDSPDEILLVFDSEVEFQVGGDWVRAGKGTLGVVPVLVSHGIRNVSCGTHPWPGFPSGGVVATFAWSVQPINQQVFGLVVTLPCCART